VERDHLLPEIGLGVFDEADDLGRKDRPLLVPVLRGTLCPTGLVHKHMLDVRLERGFRCSLAHVVLPRTSILPVTAAEIRAVRYSVRRLMADAASLVMLSNIVVCVSK